MLTRLNFIATTEIPAISRVGEKFDGYDLSGPYEQIRFDKITNNTFSMKLKHTKVATLTATLIAFGSLAGGANAALTLSINTANQTFYLTGTDDVVANRLGFVAYQFAHGSTSTFTDLTGNASTVTISLGSFDGNEVWLNFSGDSNWDLAFSTTNDDRAFTITGGGAVNAVSYAGLGDSIVPFEASIGVASGVYPAGTSQDPINVVAAVPEPSSALLLGIGALGFVTRRKRTA